MRPLNNIKGAAWTTQLYIKMENRDILLYLVQVDESV